MHIAATYVLRSQNKFFLRSNTGRASNKGKNKIITVTAPAATAAANVTKLEIFLFLLFFVFAMRENKIHILARG